MLYELIHIMKYYSIHFNRPDFLEIQANLANKFNYELVVINNGSHQGIKEKSKYLKLEYHETENISSTGSLSHGSAINQILHLIDMSSDWAILDHDMFIIDDIDFKEFDIITIKCDNVYNNLYMWPGMLLCKGGVDLSDVDFKPGVGIPGDTGCDTFRYVDKYNIKWCDVEVLGEKNKKYLQNSKAILSHKLDNKVIGYHYLNGSNWTDNDDYKDEILNKYLNI